MCSSLVAFLVCWEFDKVIVIVVVVVAGLMNVLVHLLNRSS